MNEAADARLAVRRSQKLRRSSESPRTPKLGERRECASSSWRAKRDAMVRPSSPPRRVKPCQKPSNFSLRIHRMSAPRARAPAPAPAAAPLHAGDASTSASRTPRATTWAPVNAIEPRWASHRPLDGTTLWALGSEGCRPRLSLQFAECADGAGRYPFPRRARASRGRQPSPRNTD